MADTIRRAFKGSGMSIRELSKRSDVPYAAVHGLITGDRDVQLSTVERLSKVLGLQLTQMNK